ncbi:hypothetical protein [Pantoea dispersa]|uniref:hypothetical protein n=1 Tax=Pantoea dispersa TaxID=59814 RepID=UPI001239EAE0|nr:hypothetical protein [Pantoea dispersa]KAA8673435.1 hypothetical protein F4W08_00175 [Pantoea dispersa]
MTKTVIYVDDDIDARDTYKRFLELWFGSDFNIGTPDIESDIADMLNKIISITNVVAFVFDEKLKETGKAGYLGQELAIAVRELDTKIPIYILTSASEDFSNSGPSEVEYIISKTDIDNDQATTAISARLRRHQNIYSDIVSDRAERLDYLLSKSLETSLTETEQDEFKQLNFLKDKVISLQETEMAELLKKDLDEQEMKLKKIDALIKKLG